MYSSSLWKRITLNTFFHVFIRAEAEKVKNFRSSEKLQNTLIYCVQGALDRRYRQDRMDWHTNSMPLPKKLDTNEWKTVIRIINVTDSAALNQNFYMGYLFFWWNEFSSSNWKQKVNFCNGPEYCSYWCTHLSQKIIRTELLVLTFQNTDVLLKMNILLKKIAGH